MQDFIHTHRDRILLLVAAMLGMMSLLISWLNPLAALFTVVSLGVVYLVSAVVYLERRQSSAQSAVRHRGIEKNQQRRDLRWKTSTISGF